MDISKSLKELRLRSGLKQNNAASIMGISQTYLSQVESGAKQPSTPMLELICKTYNVPAPIMYFMALTIDDIPKSKKRIFTELKPVVDNLISQFF